VVFWIIGPMGLVTKSREIYPDLSERARRMGDLVRAPALPLSEWALLLDIPLAAIDRLIASGKGPRIFRLGRRRYCRRDDIEQWVSALAESGGL
jgi:predicted DNA-binding transcriptional regulator AlpA